jgi:hypothetical protein
MLRLASQGATEEIAMRSTLVLAAAIIGLFSACAIAEKPSKAFKMDGMQVFAAGQSIGFVLRVDGYHELNGIGPFHPMQVHVISSKGYYFQVGIDSGEIAERDTYFSGSQCTGDAYIEAQEFWMMNQGLVVRVLNNVFYSDRVATVQERPYGSAYIAPVFLVPGRCEWVPGTRSLLALFPNDPSVTGVTGPSLGRPVVFGVPSTFTVP